MYKVFFNDRIVFINSELHEGAAENAYVIGVSDDTIFHTLWTDFISDKNEKNLYLTSVPEFDLMGWFVNNFRKIEAAGGVVFNLNNELLCIHRLGKWDLPKGKIDKGETSREAAIREVEEETGINGLQLEEQLDTTYHVYQSPYHNEEWVLKPTYWYRMKYAGNQKPVPQTEEAITKVIWVKQENIDELMGDTYPSLVPLFLKFK